MVTDKIADNHKIVAINLQKNMLHSMVIKFFGVNFIRVMHEQKCTTELMMDSS